MWLLVISYVNTYNWLNRNMWREEITKALPTDEQARKRLLRPEELIEICVSIQGQWTAIKALEVFAWTSCSFRENHRSLLEECWRNAVDQDDWDRLLHQASTNEGWNDKEKLQNLRNTRFSKLQKGVADQPESTLMMEILHKDSTSSLEEVLMSHKYFAEVGKLMLTAIMLGCVVEEEGIVTEEVSSPME